MFYADLHEIKDIYGEGQVDEGAVEQVGDEDWFTQDLPGHD